MANSPAAEQRLDEPGIRTLLTDQAPAFAELPLLQVEEQWDNVIWRLGDELAVRLPRRAAAAPLILNEQSALPVLSPVLGRVGVHTPLSVVRGRPSATFPWPWSVVPWLQGVPALERPRSENTGWADSLARALHALHHDAPADAPKNPVRGVPLAARDASVRSRLDALTGRRALARAWDDGLRMPPSSERVWIHGDLHPGNILVSREGALSAIIDFGDVTAGDPAYDLATAWMLFDDEGRARFRRATEGRYGESTWVRARAWAAALAAILLNASDDRPALLALGRTTAEQISGE